MQRRGSLHPGRRLEQAIGALIYTYLNSKGADVDIYQFMPHEDAPKDDSTTDVMAVFQMLKAGAKHDDS